MRIVPTTAAYVTWDPTRWCNGRCRHCFAEATIKSRGSPDLTFEEFQRSLAHLRLPTGTRIRFVGGEPTTRPDLLSWLRACIESGYRPEVATNGILLDDSSCRDLKNVTSYVNLSLEGPAEVHEMLRGRGMFDKAMSGLAALATSGIPFGLQATVIHNTLGYLPWLIETARQFGARDLNLALLSKWGRAEKRLPTHVFPSLSDVEEIAEYASRCDRRGLNVHLNAYPKSQLFRYAPSIRHQLLCLKQPHIQNDGTVTPYLECQHASLSLGNLLDTSLAEMKRGKRYREVRKQIDMALHATFRDAYNLSGSLVPFSVLLQSHCADPVRANATGDHPSPFRYRAVTAGCKGCGVCIDLCANDARALVAQMAVVDQAKCIGCGECREACPYGAIRVLRCSA
jgi:MoaA/NifB/PqqE/SkfB family radical SAM enzyme/NAD-dependent dihydropyrimidine dehydrogenase PreA subunit